MPAADMIAAGELDRYTADFRRCRDQNLSRNCGDYASQRLAARNPTESLASINSVAAQGRSAIDAGNAANQSRGDRTINPGGRWDPSQILGRAGIGGALRYRYTATVSGTIGGGTMSGTTFSYRVTINSSSPLTVDDIRNQATSQVQAIAERLERQYDRLGGGDLASNITVRIEAAYRDRA
jgi:hypothetical protein